MADSLMLPFDVTANRHKGNPNSIKANKRISEFKTNDRDSIRIQVAATGFAGLTINEVKLWNASKARFKYPNEFSGRITELVIKEKIFDSHRRRDNCAVYVTRPEHVTPEGQQ